MTSKREELKPCPFCGGEAEEGMFNVWCTVCYAETYREDTDITTRRKYKNWNRRAGDDKAKDAEIGWLRTELERLQSVVGEEDYEIIEGVLGKALQGGEDK